MMLYLLHIFVKPKTQTMTIFVKIKPHLKDFLIHQYGLEPIPSTKRNLIGLIIDPLMEKTPPNYAPKFISQQEKFNYIEIELTCQSKLDQKRKAVDSYYYLSRDNEIHFSKAIEKFFESLFFLHMDTRISFAEKNNFRFQYKTLIEEFIDTYELSYEHISYDTLKKSYFRKRKNNEEKVCADSSRINNKKNGKINKIRTNSM